MKVERINRTVNNILAVIYFLFSWFHLGVNGHIMPYEQQIFIFMEMRIDAIRTEF